jgi:hypothetical protein
LPKIWSYSNASGNLTIHGDKYLGFGNCLPNEPLKKVEAGKISLEEICKQNNKIELKDQLIEQLLMLLKSEERYIWFTNYCFNL